MHAFGGKLVPAACMVLLLSGCGVGDWFGSGDEEILPGERIAILGGEQELRADPEIAAVQVDLPAPARNEEWPQVGGGATHAMGNLEVGGALSVSWRADIGVGFSDDGLITSQPIVVNGRVYVMDAFSLVTALSPGGQRVWQVDLELEGEEDGYFGGGLASDGERLYVTTGFGVVFALELSSGAVIWQTQLPAPMRAAPTVAGGAVYAITINNTVYALDAASGEEQWEHTGIQEIAGLVGAASPAVSGSTVVVPYTSGEIYGLLAETGRVLWTDSLAGINRVDQTNQLAQIRGLPVIADNLVYAISNSGRMSAIDLRRGLRLWDAGIGGTETPWVAGDFLFVVTNSWQLVAVSRRDGRIRWATPLERWQDPDDREDLINWVGPVVASDRVLVASSTGVLSAYSPRDGSLIGSTDLGSGILTAPVVAGGTLYLINREGTLLALR